MKNHPKKKTTEVSVANIIIFSAVTVLIATFCLFLFVFNANYCKIYKSPEVQNGKIDFTGVDLYPRDVACNLSGKWEFYYNRWIITDGYDGESDGQINIPSLWTYKDYGNGKLPKTGYASYKLVAENIEAGCNVVVFRHNENFAYRVFINGELNYVSGTLSKTPSETVATGVPSEIYPYLSDGSPLEIVIELSATNYGGLNASPWLAVVEGGVEYGDSLRAFTYVVLGISVTAVIISLLLATFFRSKQGLSLSLFMVFMLVHFISSKDMMYVCNLSFALTSVLRLISAIFSFGFFIRYLIHEGAEYSKPHIVLALSLSIVFSLLLVLFYGTNVSLIFAFFLLFVAVSFILPIYLKRRFSILQAIIYGVLFELLITTFIFEFCDALGLLKFGTEFIFSLVLTFIILCLAVLMLYKISKTAKGALRAKRLEKELVTMENKVLKAQIKPHFIYNALTSIQHQYRNGLADGDEAVVKFASFLRTVTDCDTNTVPFEDEIKNLLNYFELENLRYGEKINLLLDLKYTDFSIPFLTLQPFVENSLKHADLLKVKNAYVEISSTKLDNGKVEICIRDNGKGFDTEKVKFGVGIQNTKKRLSLFDSDVIIESKLNEGTIVTITIREDNL